MKLLTIADMVYCGHLKINVVKIDVFVGDEEIKAQTERRK